MAGIIASAKDSEPVDTVGQEAELTPASVRGQMQVPPEMQEPYERLVMAGKKILYSEAMAPQIQELLQAPGDIGSKIGQGVVALLALLIDKSNGTLPPQLIIPAGVELAVEAGAFLRDAGQKVTKEDIAEGTAVMVGEILQRAGVSMEQLPQLLGGQGAAAPEPDGDEGQPGPGDMDGDEEA